MKRYIVASVLFLAAPSAFAEQICMSDGTCISDPSLTGDPNAAAYHAQQVNPSLTALTQTPTSLDQLNTDRMKLIQDLCYGTSSITNQPNRAIKNYADSQTCFNTEMAQMKSDREAIVAKNKKAAGSDSSEGGKGNGGGSPSGGQQPQQQAQNPQQGQQGQQGQNPSSESGKGGSGSPSGEAAKAADAGKGGEGGKGGGKGGGQCQARVKQAFEACVKERDAAKVVCDANKDTGVIAANDNYNQVGAVTTVNSSARNAAAQSALAADGVNQSLTAFAGKCDVAVRSCDTKCEKVQEAFDQSCKNASKSDQEAGRQVVERSKDEEHQKMCTVTLAGKSGQARSQASAMGQSAEQQAGVTDKSGSNGGGMGGAAGALSGLAGLKQNQGKEKEQQNKEYQALQKSMQEIAAQEGYSTTCQRTEYRCMSACAAYVSNQSASCGTYSPVGRSPASVPTPVQQDDRAKTPAEFLPPGVGY